MTFLEYFFIIIVLIFLLMTVLTFYVYQGFSKKGKTIIRHGPRDFKKISLTFDDGPNPRYTPEILKILKKYNIKATFFIVALNVKKYPILSRRIAFDGHDIANHSYNHGNLLITKNSTLKKNIVRANEIIDEVTGVYPSFFRPPRGLYNKKMIEMVSDLGMETVLWNLSSYDWRGTKPKKIAEIVFKKIKNGDIILFHDSGNLFYKKQINHENTIKTLPLVIEGLIKKGFEIVPLSELLEIESK